MMTESAAAEARASLREWTDEGRRVYRAITELVEAPPESIDDPVMLVPYLQAYVNSLPLDEFEESDWVTLHADLVTYLAEAMTQRRGGVWLVHEDPASRRGFRYLLEVTDRHGNRQALDPFEIVAYEFRNRPIEIIRMLASAEASAGITPLITDQ